VHELPLPPPFVVHVPSMQSALSAQLLKQLPQWSTLLSRFSMHASPHIAP